MFGILGILGILGTLGIAGADGIVGMVGNVGTEGIAGTAGMLGNDGGAGKAGIDGKEGAVGCKGIAGICGTGTGGTKEENVDKCQRQSSARRKAVDVVSARRVANAAQVERFGMCVRGVLTKPRARNVDDVLVVLLYQFGMYVMGVMKTQCALDAPVRQVLLVELPGWYV
uniref:Collagen IV NC1 domain-containing protein n=1 Tax=Glossina brevipalpis TaxID=37001 RepID=A0A1A9WVL1_9MUSC